MLLFRKRSGNRIFAEGLRHGKILADLNEPAGGRLVKIDDLYAGGMIHRLGKDHAITARLNMCKYPRFSNSPPKRWTVRKKCACMRSLPSD